MNKQKPTTVELGYYMQAPITLNGTKYALNKVYTHNKQVSK